MKPTKRTYSLPTDVLDRLGRLASGERLAEREREELRRQVIEGCKEMGGLYKEIDKEWNSAADEVWRDHD